MTGLNAEQRNRLERWIACIAKARRLSKWAANPVPSEKMGYPDFAWEASHDLRFMLWVGRSGHLKKTDNPSGPLFFIGKHTVKMALDIWTAREGVAYTHEGPKKGAVYYEGAIVVCPPGHGKCLGKGTPVLMYDGTIKNAEDVEFGDLLMGPDSTPRTVLSTCTGREELFRVTPVKGDSYVVNRSHILSLRMNAGDALLGKKRGDIVNISVADYLKTGRYFKSRAKGWRTGVEWESQEVPVPPYIFGCWLGDGHSDAPSITTMDEAIRDAFDRYAQSLGHKLIQHKHQNSGKATTYVISAGGQGYKTQIAKKLKDMGVLGKGKKSIPREYLVNDRQSRLELLAGLIDTDGCLNKPNNYEIVTKSARLSEDILFLARSLGFAAYSKPCEKKCTNNGRVGVYYRISIAGECSEIPVRIDRKRAGPRRQVKNVCNVGISVESIGEGDYYGFTLDGDRLFLLGDFTVTHNTQMVCHHWANRIRKHPDSQIMAGHAIEAEAIKNLKYIATLFRPDTPNGRRCMAISTNIVLDDVDNTQKMIRVKTNRNLRQPTMSAHGMMGALSGGDATDIALDDPVDQAEAHSEAERNRKYERIIGTWMTRKRGAEAFDLTVTTLWHEEDANCRRIRQAREGNEPILVSIQGCGGPDQNFEPLCEELCSRAKLKSMYHKSPHLYSCAYMSDPVGKAKRLLDRLRYYNPNAVEHKDFMLKARRHLSADPSATGHSKSDLAGVVYAAEGVYQWRMADKDGRIHHMREKRLRILSAAQIQANQPDLCRYIADFVDRNDVDEIHIESRSGFNATADMLEDFFGLSCVRHDPGQKGKEYRVRAASPLLDDSGVEYNGPRAVVEFPGVVNDDGQIVCDPQFEWLVRQFLKFGSVKDDHCLDAVVQLALGLELHPGKGPLDVGDPSDRGGEVKMDPAIRADLDRIFGKTLPGNAMEQDFAAFGGPGGGVEGDFW